MRNYDNYTPQIDYADQKSGSAEETPDKIEEGAKRRNRRKVVPKDRQPKPASVNKRNRPSSFRKLYDWVKSPQARILFGIFMGCLAIYLAVSFVGYFSTCVQDQSRIASNPIGYAPKVDNPGGEGGARLSEFLINEGFGLGSLVIIVWLGAISLKMLVGRPRFKTLDFTIKCLVALITVSLIIGLVTYSMHTSVNWGGYHGTYVNEFIINFIGAIGAILLSIFMIALFIVISMRDLINWIIRYRRARAEKKRMEAEERAARVAREEEIRRMHEEELMEDMRAGEAAIMADGYDPSDSAVADNAPVEFGNEDGSLYEISDDPDNDLRTNHGDTESTEKERAEDNVSSIDGSGPGFISPDADKSDAGDLASEPRESAHAPGEKVESGTNHQDDKMVVNVNTIDRTDANHFKSQVEIFESHKYKFPPYELLCEGEARVNVNADEQIENKHKIKKTLLDFGIPITNIEATVGPTVTLYEIVPDAGVKIARIRSLVDDIALSLSARGVRIIAPIPGKGTVGIEVANKDPQKVSMRTIIQSKKYQESKYALPIALGSTISNDVYIADLAKMPHLLVAGATGQGKSVGLNAIIASLLYCKAPHEIKFVMIDPKQVEFSLYNKLKNYYMAVIPGEDDEPVITDMAKVEATLSSLCVEMDQRYTLLKNAHVRNIEEYNRKIREGSLNPAEGHRFLPYIVVIVDEFGDLIMVSGKSVEMPIARLAQKARAVGMHVIIATQRPSTNVITGIIKANFPARISFKVSSGVDSKTILDTPGAQQLIGRGDMLIFNNSEMVRVQCAFMDTPEVERLCEYIERQPYPMGVYELPEPVNDNGDSLGGESSPVGERDPLFTEVARAVVNSAKASTSSVQRHYEIGYNRAGRIMDQLERAGIVGPAQGGKPRAVLVDPIRLEEILGSLD